MGTSAALLGRIRELEAEKEALARQVAEATAVATIVPNVEEAIRQRVRALELIPRHALMDADLCQKARDAVQGLLGGPVEIVEDASGVFAKVEMGRWYLTRGAGGGT